jgi:Flp pilus assembly secretin CpaC
VAHNVATISTFFIFVTHSGASSSKVGTMILRMSTSARTHTTAIARAATCILSLSAVTLASSAAFAQAPSTVGVERRGDLVVNFDQSTLLQLSRPADLVIVGNPSIADVAIQSGTLLVITGKSFGITNIIVLDSERKVIQDQRLMVRRDEDKVVNLLRGKDRQTWNCAGGQCNPTLTVGDDPVYFGQVKESASSKASASEKSGDAGGSNN